jgi:hypothetical protein
MVIFRNRMNWQPSKAEVRYPILDPEAYHDAKLVAPGYDVHWLEQEWRDWWVESGMPELGFPGKAFIAFCKKRYQMKPNP